MLPSPLLGLSSLCLPQRAYSQWRASLKAVVQSYSCSVIAVLSNILL